MILTVTKREIRSKLTNAFSVAHQASNSDAYADADQHRLQEMFLTGTEALHLAHEIRE